MLILKAKDLCPLFSSSVVTALVLMTMGKKYSNLDCEHIHISIRRS